MPVTRAFTLCEVKQRHSGCQGNSLWSPFYKNATCILLCNPQPPSSSHFNLLEIEQTSFFLSLTHITRSTPYHFHLYGNSSLGESVKLLLGSSIIVTKGE